MNKLAVKMEDRYGNRVVHNHVSRSYDVELDIDFYLVGMYDGANLYAEEFQEILGVNPSQGLEFLFYMVERTDEFYISHLQFQEKMWFITPLDLEHPIDCAALVNMYAIYLTQKLRKKPKKNLINAVHRFLGLGK